MESRSDNNSNKVIVANPWCRSAVATAIVSGIFALIVFSVIVINYVQTTVIDTKMENKLEVLKAEVKSRPNDEKLLSQIRQLDLQFRQNQIRRFDRSHKGSYLLLGGIAIFLISIKCVDILNKKMPTQGAPTNKSNEQLRQAMFSRLSVIAGAIIISSIALFLSTGPKIYFSQAQTGTAIASWPTMEEVHKNWPSFRGPEGLGISAYTNIPAIWDANTNQGILWKTKVPLPGNNSPVVWGKRVFLSGGDPNELQVFCFDADSGEHLWTGDVTRTIEGKPLDVWEDTGYSAPTVATDGQRVYAIFVTGDVGCFDYNGRKVWEKSLGIPDSAYGYASSLAMYRNLLLIQYDQGMAEDQKSAVIALDGSSGRIVWQTKRPVGGSWSSPIVTPVGNEYQLITCSDPFVIAYDPANGTELWRVDCLGADTAPSPIYAGELVFAIEPYSKLTAIKPDGRGDVTETHIAWKIEEGGPDICSPVSDGELIFLLATEGWLSCFSLSDQKRVWEKDLGESFLASPTLVGDKLYLLSEDGNMLIVEVEPEYKQIAKCELGEKCYASPAFLDGRIYIRGSENLYCIGNSD
jgi:outer membrane protein assembly factor BamB